MPEHIELIVNEGFNEVEYSPDLMLVGCRTSSEFILDAQAISLVAEMRSFIIISRLL